MHLLRTGAVIVKAPANNAPLHYPAPGAGIETDRILRNVINTRKLKDGSVTGSRIVIEKVHEETPQQTVTLLRRAAQHEPG